jgi:hypothetical protein
MKTERELRTEIDKIIADIESTKDEPDLQAHLNTVLGVLLWVVGESQSDWFV